MFYNDNPLHSARSLPLISMRDSDGFHVLMHAVRSGQKALTARIIGMCSDAEINAKNNDDWNTLAFAAQNSCEQTIGLLLARGARVNECLSGGQLAIGIGCQNNFSLNCCELLLRAGTVLTLCK